MSAYTNKLDNIFKGMEGLPIVYLIEIGVNNIFVS